ncbi:MAG TPA: UvrD-helicase domain-containing protein [Acidimicrobiales bacterium]|nr:UvrD-helicase domain-containing protein [Acidimicrobiales bacterium]
MDNDGHELIAERDYVDAAYERLQELRAKARQLAGEAYWRDEDYVVDSLFERDVVAAQAAHRLAALDVPKGRMAVGRLDRDDGDRWYIGRLAVADAAGDPLIIDWRAPAAAAFYRAVAGDPMGVVRRRHFRWRGDELVGLDDEVLDTEAAARGELDLVGEGALLAAVAAPRTGRMTDVVATIQAEQDRVIRRPKAGVLVVQGAPGTGKTAVALHRAAYLLYAEHQSFRGSAILFVGPNDTFLRYVEEVVPSLGEDRVVLVTPAELGPPVAVGRHEPEEVVRVKGDARMATFLARAVRARQRAPKDEVAVPCGRFVLHVTAEALDAVVRRARRAGGTHNGRRRQVERGVVAALQSALDDARDREVRHGVVAPPEQAPPVLELLDRRAVAGIVDGMWPLLTPERFLRSLYASPRRLARAGRDLLTDEEVALLHRQAGEDDPWSVADVALLDELATLLGPLPERRRRRAPASEEDPMVDRLLADLLPSCPECGAELTYLNRGTEPQHDRLRCDVCEPVRYFRTWAVMGDFAAQQLRSVHDSIVARNFTPDVAGRPGDLAYGHVVVDEAQDLSAMQWRALARRCPTRSMTIAGDQDQAIRPGGTGSWEAAVAALEAEDFELAELTVNYRTPIEVMAAAEDVLAAAGVATSRTRSVRSTQEPAVTEVGAITTEVVADVVAGLVAGPAAGGTVAVIAPLARCADLAGIGVPVLDVTEAKGLEFDAVVVVDPDAIAAEGEGGARRVYVAMTRTTNALHVLRP